MAGPKTRTWEQQSLTAALRKNVRGVSSLGQAGLEVSSTPRELYSSKQQIMLSSSVFGSCCQPASRALLALES
eukprot:2079102-Amphidinium_carterae.1